MGHQQCWKLWLHARSQLCLSWVDMPLAHSCADRVRVCAAEERCHALAGAPGQLRLVLFCLHDELVSVTMDTI